jgi:hypothetical protein
MCVDRRIAIDARLLQANSDLQPFLLGDRPRFPQNFPQDRQNSIVALAEVQLNDSLTGKDHGGAEFGVATFHVG